MVLHLCAAVVPGEGVRSAPDLFERKDWRYLRGAFDRVGDIAESMHAREVYAFGMFRAPGRTGHGRLMAAPMEVQRQLRQQELTQAAWQGIVAQCDPAIEHKDPPTLLTVLQSVGAQLSA